MEMASHILRLGFGYHAEWEAVSDRRLRGLCSYSSFSCSPNADTRISLPPLVCKRGSRYGRRTL